MSPEWVKLKTEKFGVMEQKHKRERPHREWADDIEDWARIHYRNCIIWRRIEMDEDGESADTGGLRARRSWCKMMMIFDCE